MHPPGQSVCRSSSPSSTGNCNHQILVAASKAAAGAAYAMATLAWQAFSNYVSQASLPLVVALPGGLCAILCSVLCARLHSLFCVLSPAVAALSRSRCVPAEFTGLLKGK